MTRYLVYRLLSAIPVLVVVSLTSFLLIFLVPGDPAKSSMYVRVSLPPDDLDIMPAEGDPLTAAQIDTLKRWIAEGADFGGWSGAGG